MLVSECRDGAKEKGKRRDQVIYYQFRADRARRTLHGIAALAVSRWVEARPGWSIRKFVRTARRYRTIDPLPDDLRHALDAINHDG